MTAALLLLAVVAWVALPFLPAVYDAVCRRDDARLPISDRYREDLHLGGADHDPVLVDERGAPLADGPHGAPLVVRHAFTGPDGFEADDLRVHGLARLGAGTVIRRRLNAGASVEVGRGSVLRGSAEAEDLMWIGADCEFERIHAPTIQVGVGTGELPHVPEAAAFELPPEVEVRAGRALVRGDLSLPPGARLGVDLVVTGTLTLGVGARIRGSVKAREDLFLEAGAVVAGNAVAEGAVRLGPSAIVTGAAVAGETLEIGPSAQIGRPSAPTSATGRDVYAAWGACVHGTLWAQEAGRTGAPEAVEAVAA